MLSSDELVFSEREERVLNEIHGDEIVELSRSLVSFPSFKEEEADLARWLGGYFSDRGYDVDLQEVTPGRFQTIATLRGSGGGKSMMFNGHLDIDPLSMGWETDPFELKVDGDSIIGAGISNMKGGDAAMIAAAEAIRRSGVDLPGDLVVACVVGELQGGVGTHHLMQTGLRTDMAIVPEPMGSENIMTIHSGVMHVAVSTLGASQHTMYRPESVDAIEKMLSVIPALYDVDFTCERRDDLPRLPLVNVGAIIGGRGRNYDLKGANYVSDFCTVVMDIRTLPGQTMESVLADVRQRLDQLKAEDPELQFEVESPPNPEFGGFRVVFEPTEVPVDEYIVQLVTDKYQLVTGKPPAQVGVLKDPYSYAGTDLSHLWMAGIPGVVYGPSSGGPSSGTDMRTAYPEESMSVADLTQVSKILALSALDVCGTVRS